MTGDAETDHLAERMTRTVIRLGNRIAGMCQGNARLLMPTLVMVTFNVITRHVAPGDRLRAVDALAADVRKQVEHCTVLETMGTETIQ